MNLRSVLIAVLVVCGTDRIAYTQQIGVTYSAAAQTESALKSVSPASQAVMERLSHLDSLPVGDLRYFAGDVPNGAPVELDDLSWQTIRVPEGSAFVVVGANGAGKTTMIKILMNLLEATSGTAKIFGVDSRKLSPKELAQIGYVSENQELPGKLTVEENLNYLRPFYSEWDKHLEAETLRQFRLPGDRRITELSHGMRVKLALTCALPYRPKLLVLDEPFSGLDPLVRDEFMEGLQATRTR